MVQVRRASAGPSPEWRVPAAVWAEIINRYAIFIQVPGWRVSVKSDGSEKRACFCVSEASVLGEQMMSTLDRVLPRRSGAALSSKATISDLKELAGQQGRHIPRDRRCSTKIGLHLLRAFLFNAAAYSCLYCGRTAWDVYSEDTGTEPRRTLRFEIDHRTTRRRLRDPDLFDPANLVVACRSCNTIKGELPEARFRRELESLASAVYRARVSGA